MHLSGMMLFESVEVPFNWGDEVASVGHWRIREGDKRLEAAWSDWNYKLKPENAIHVIAPVEAELFFYRCTVTIIE